MMRCGISRWLGVKIAFDYINKITMNYSMLLAFSFVVIATALAGPSQTLNNKWISSGAHDSKCYTQGLSFINETHVLQSCGMYGSSFYHILTYNETEGQTELVQVYKSAIFDSSIFVEGSVLFQKTNIIYILTWEQNIVYRFNVETHQQIEPTARLQWSKEGWGLTQNATHMFITDGSSNIFVVNQTIQILQTIAVVDEKGKPLKSLNQIEWVKQDGKQYIYSNVYGSNFIVKIQVSSGKVVQRFYENKMIRDSDSYPQGPQSQDVLNGIAFHTSDNKFILTGKYWPRYYISYLDQTELCPST